MKPGLLINLLREPLLHFVALGAALFLGYALLSKQHPADQGAIVVSRGQIERLQTGFARAHQRQPSKEELDGLVQDYIREEVYVREAFALGLDRDDVVIRRRLRQKMEFVSDDVAVRAAPTDDELRAYIKDHQQRFLIDERYRFRQVFLDPARRAANLQRDAERLRQQLDQAGSRADTTHAGDPFLLERDFDSIAAAEIEKLFGHEFVEALRDVAPGAWRGPLKSGYGMHLVIVTQRTPGRAPALDEVRDAVRREWNEARRVEINEKFYRGLLQRYRVSVEQTKQAAAQPVSEARR